MKIRKQIRVKHEGKSLRLNVKIRKKIRVKYERKSLRLNVKIRKQIRVKYEGKREIWREEKETRVQDEGKT